MYLIDKLHTLYEYTDETENFLLSWDELYPILYKVHPIIRRYFPDERLLLILEHNIKDSRIDPDPLDFLNICIVYEGKDLEKWFNLIDDCINELQPIVLKGTKNLEIGDICMRGIREQMIQKDMKVQAHFESLSNWF